MTRRITNDEYLSLALRYNEQRTINDSLQREITELKEKNEIWGRYVRECMTEMDELKDKLDEFAVNEEDKYNAGAIWVRGNLDNDTGEGDASPKFVRCSSDEYNERNRIS